MTFEEFMEKDDNGYQDFEHGWYTAKRAWDAATKACCPEGYVVVPIEPTESMITAWWDEVDRGGKIINAARSYKAMIKAAQEQE